MTPPLLELEAAGWLQGWRGCWAKAQGLGPKSATYGEDGMSDWLQRLNELDWGEIPVANRCQNTPETQFRRHNGPNGTGISVFSIQPPLRCRGGPLRCLPDLSPGGVLALAQIP